MKKLLSLVLALVMVMGLTTAAWGATSVSDTAGFIAALENKEDVVLNGNVTVNTAMWLAGSDPGYAILAESNIDGKGNKITDNTQSIYGGLYAEGAALLTNFTLESNSLYGLYLFASGTNSVTVKDVVINKTSDNSAIYISGSDAGVVLENVTVTASAVSNPATAANAAVFATKSSSGAASKVTIKSGTYTATNADGFAVASFYGSEVTIESGTFTGKLTEDTAGGEIVVKGGIFNTDPTPYLASGYQTAKVGSAGGTFVVGQDIKVDADGNITGGTFSSAVPAAEYVADGFELVSDGAGGFVAVKDVANTSSASGLYAKGTEKGAVKQENVTLNFFKAVDNKVDKKTGAYVADGNLAYYMIDGVITKYAEVYTLADADMVIYTDEACKDVYMYLDVINPIYYGDGVKTTNFGTACGQYSNDETKGFDDEATYYVAFENLYVGVEAGAAYQMQLLVNGELVQVNPVNIPVNEHKAIYTRNDKSEIVSIKCSVCGLAAVKAPNYASLPVKPDMVDENVAPLWYWPVASSTPSTDKVTSAETFDAGIAMYVGMSIMAATGSAVVIGKKKD